MAETPNLDMRNLTAEEKALAEEFLHPDPEKERAEKRRLAEKACEAMGLRYGRPFAGDGIQTRPDGSLRVMMHPAAQPEVVFTMTLTPAGELLDDFPARSAACRLEKELRSALAERGRTCYALCTFPGIRAENASPETDPEVFIARHGVGSVLCRLLFRGTGERTDAEAAAGEMRSRYGIGAAVKAFVLTEEAYDRLTAGLGHLPILTEAIAGHFDPVSRFDFRLTN